MPEWMHRRADHLMAKNPSMPKGEAFAIATQQMHAAGKTPRGYGTSEGKHVAKQKYDEPKSHYTQTADPKEKTAMFSITSAVMAGFRDEFQKIAYSHQIEYDPHEVEVTPYTKRERARSWGGGGGALGFLGGGIAGGIAGALSNHPAGGLGVPAGALGGMALGIGAGRLLHRLKHGKATDEVLDPNRFAVSTPHDIEDVTVDPATAERFRQFIADRAAGKHVSPLKRDIPSLSLGEHGKFRAHVDSEEFQQKHAEVSVMKPMAPEAMAAPKATPPRSPTSTKGVLGPAKVNAEPVKAPSAQAQPTLEPPAARR